MLFIFFIFFAALWCWSVKDKSLLSSIHKSVYNENKIELEKNRELIIDKIVIEIEAAIFDEMLAEIVLQMLELFHSC